MPSPLFELVAWQSFFSALSSATATIAGLLFVSLSCHLELLMRDGHQHAQSLATQTFAMFLYVLIVALLLLLPHGTRPELALEVAAVAAVGLTGALVLLAQTLRASPITAFRRDALHGTNALRRSHEVGGRPARPSLVASACSELAISSKAAAREGVARLRGDRRGGRGSVLDGAAARGVSVSDLNGMAHWLTPWGKPPK